MKHSAAIVLVFLLLGTGCVTRLPKDKPFSEAWYKHQRHEREFSDRLDRMKGGEWVLAGQQSATRAAVQLDEDGKPKLNVGKRNGLSADVDVSTDDASVFFKYRWSWKTKPKPKKNQ